MSEPQSEDRPVKAARLTCAGPLGGRREEEMGREQTWGLCKNRGQAPGKKKGGTSLEDGGGWDMANQYSHPPIRRKPLMERRMNLEGAPVAPWLPEIHLLRRTVASR